MRSAVFHHGFRCDLNTGRIESNITCSIGRYDRMKRPSQRLDLSASALPSGPEWPVTVLPNGGGKRWLAQGIDNLLAIDPTQLTSMIHRRVYDATLTGEVYHDA